MAMYLELPDNLYERIRQLAHSSNLEPAELIENLLDQSTKEDSDVFGWLVENAIDFGVDDLSENLDHYLYGSPKRG